MKKGCEMSYINKDGHKVTKKIVKKRVKKKKTTSKLKEEIGSFNEENSIVDGKRRFSKESRSPLSTSTSIPHSSSDIPSYPIGISNSLESTLLKKAGVLSGTIEVDYHDDLLKSEIEKEKKPECHFESFMRNEGEGLGMEKKREAEWKEKHRGYTRDDGTSASASPTLPIDESILQPDNFFSFVNSPAHPRLRGILCICKCGDRGNISILGTISTPIHNISSFFSKENLTKAIITPYKHKEAMIYPSMLVSTQIPISVGNRVYVIGRGHGTVKNHLQYTSRWTVFVQDEGISNIDARELRVCVDQWIIESRMIK
ncbi:hypothetical protein ADUPG1_011544 [Aduncisulcus paluster]|uniref:Uncharacterized protein n=1 Tax=Aduncisulcus paluster TaxID=2918883 RepID=A0ABQ5JZG5_9EUKA|nr:hypothetical protein ADUPG1_011544 [Aduncisulcus paluster]